MTTRLDCVNKFSGRRNIRELGTLAQTLVQMSFVARRLWANG